MSKYDSDKLVLGVGAAAVSLLLTPNIFSVLGGGVGNAIDDLFGETFFLAFVFGFPGLLSAFLYLLGCKFLKKEGLSENITGGVIIGAVTIPAWLVYIIVEGSKAAIR